MTRGAGTLPAGTSGAVPVSGSPLAGTAVPAAGKVTTVPYPWPFDGPPAGGRVALVVAGCRPARWQAGPAGRVDAVVEALTAAAGAVRRAGGTVVHVHHGDPPGRPPDGPTHGGPEPTDGIAGHWQARPMPLPVGGGDLVVGSAGIDAFFGGPLDAVLRRLGITHLAVGGFGLEGPVHSTLRSANDRGYECLLLADASLPVDDATATAALSMVTMSGGIFGAVGPTTALLAVLAAAGRP